MKNPLFRQARLLPLLLPLLAALLLVLAAAAMHYSHAAPDAVVKSAPAHTDSAIDFADDAAQWSSLKVMALLTSAMPVAEAVNGRISYDENRTARVSSPIAGRVTALRVEAGDSVAAGAMLAQIDAPDLATAQSDWRKAHADERRKALAFERAQILLAGEVLARKDFEAAQADLLQAVAESARASQRLKSLNAGPGEAGLFGLRAPVAGVVAERQINPGQEVRPDLPMPLFVISDLHQLWVLVDLPEGAAGAIQRGQAVAIETDAWPGRRFDATVVLVAGALDAQTHRLQVRCAVANPQLLLKPEMFARVAFLAAAAGPGLDTPRAVQLPNTSLFSEGVYEFVFVEARHGHFVKRRVHVALRGHDSSWLDGGLRSGERVVTEGALLLNAEMANHAESQPQTPGHDHAQ